MLVEDDSGTAITEECLYHCAPGRRVGCEDPECCCDCHARSLDDIAAEVRAADLDDRPADKLAVIANELDRERRGELRDLTAERFGGGRRG